MMTIGGGRLVELTLEGSPWRSAAGRFTHRKVLLLELEDDRGEKGWGEACPLPGYSPDTLEQARKALEAWLAEMPRAVTLSAAPGLRLEGARTASLPTSARCAVEGALLDLAARRAHRPLHRWLATDAAEVVSCQGLVPLLAPDAALSRARRLWASGFRTLKVKGGEDFTREKALLQRLRRTFGEPLTLRLDVGGRWPPDRAPGRLEALAALGLDYVEEPVAPPGLLTLPDVPVPLAADESLQDPVLAAEILDAGVCAALVLKPPCVGGPLRALALAEAARRRGMRWALSHTLGSGVERALAVALALASGASCSGLAEHPFLPDGHRPPAWSGPELRSLGTPGLGLAGEGFR
ncbi:MAG: enolase C-terminal domain-like protein [Acidobacteriota bacterium]|nr:enolase C-terminal domain-like protein [Acidobacteriota bacterium]